MTLSNKVLICSDVRYPETRIHRTLYKCVEQITFSCRSLHVSRDERRLPDGGCECTDTLPDIKSLSWRYSGFDSISVIHLQVVGMFPLNYSGVLVSILGRGRRIISFDVDIKIMFVRRSK